MSWTRFSGLAVGLAAAVLACGSAQAQIGRSDAPIEINADQGEFLQNEGRVVYTGNVQAIQGESRITTNKLTAFCRQGPASSGEAPACEAIDRLVAEGNIFYTAPDVKIKGDRAQYDYPTDTITITGDVILSRGADGVVRGKQVVYQVAEGRTVITAGNDRVVSLFTTAPREQTAPATPPQN